MGSNGGGSGGSPSFHRTVPTLFLATPTVAATTFVVIIKCPAFKFRRLLLFFFGPPIPRVVRRWRITKWGSREAKGERCGENERGRLRWRLILSIPAGGRGYGRTISLKEH